MTRTLEFFDEALAEAEEAARWYAERSTIAATGFVEELDSALEHVQSTPETWPTYEHGTRRFLLRRFPYSVVYLANASRIVIVAVARAQRRPGYWRRRLGRRA